MASHSSFSTNDMRMTDTHIFFWHSVLSNWHQGPNFSGTRALEIVAPRLQAIWIPIPPREKRSSQLILRHGFNCGEQFMMACKAWLFDQDPDAFILRSILASKKPFEQKALGRKVPGFTDSVWQAASVDIVVASQIARAEVDQRLARMYQNSGNKVFVEGSPKDRIWGVGIHWKEKAIEDERNWMGENRLGLCHCLARQALREQKQAKLAAATAMQTMKETPREVVAQQQPETGQSTKDGESMKDHKASEVSRSVDSDGGMEMTESLDSHESMEIDKVVKVNEIMEDSGTRDDTKELEDAEPQPGLDHTALAEPAEPAQKSQT